MALTKISTAMWNSVPHHDTHDFNVDDVLYVDVSANRVGIGTTNPDVQLHVKSSGTTFSQVRVEAGADGHDSSVAYSQAGIIKGISGYDDSTDTVAIKYGTFSGGGIDINSSGNVGIGISPVRKLDVDSGTSSDIVRFGNDSLNDIWANYKFNKFRFSHIKRLQNKTRCIYSFLYKYEWQRRNRDYKSECYFAHKCNR